MAFLILVATFVLLDIVALRWGIDSRDSRPDWG